MEEFDDNILESEAEQQRLLLEAQQKERNEIFADLEAYLEEFKGKKDAEGKPLVSFPKNFDKVTASMSRKDLYSEDNAASWSRCLLASRFDDDLLQASFEGGRYKSVVKEHASELRVERGMAEIAMMDKQLQALNRKAADISSTIDTPSSARYKSNRSRQRSRSSPKGVFLTRQLDSAATTPAQTPLGTPLASARSADFEIQSSDEEADELDDKDENDDIELNKLKLREDEAVGTIVEESLDDDNEDIDNTAAPTRSAEERELFIQALLADNEEGVEDNFEASSAWLSIASFGFSENMKSRLADIDMELEMRFGREISAAANSEALEDVSAEVAPENYLLQQRAQRSRDNYSAQLSTILRTYRNTLTDLSGLVASDDPSTPTSGPLPSCSSNRSVLQIPNINDIHPEQPVSLQDIATAITELQQHSTELAKPELIQALLRNSKADIDRLRSLRGGNNNKSTDSITSPLANTPSEDECVYAAAMEKYRIECASGEYDNEDSEDNSNSGHSAASDIFSRLQLMMASRNTSASDQPPPLARMTAAELKEAKTQEHLLANDIIAATAPLHVEDKGTVENAMFKHQTRSATEGVKYDLQAMHNRLERMLNRATNYANAPLEENEEDVERATAVADVMHSLLDSAIEEAVEEVKPAPSTKRIVI